MACSSCGKRRVQSPQTALLAGARVYHEVWREGVFTGRRFTSLPEAQRYAKSVGGTVRPR